MDVLDAGELNICIQSLENLYIQTKTISSLSAVRTSTQDEWPPTSILSRSGVGNDPRTPQNLMQCLFMMNNLLGLHCASQEFTTIIY